MQPFWITVSAAATVKLVINKTIQVHKFHVLCTRRKTVTACCTSLILPHVRHNNNISIPTNMLYKYNCVVLAGESYKSKVLHYQAAVLCTRSGIMPVASYQTNTLFVNRYGWLVRSLTFNDDPNTDRWHQCHLKWNNETTTVKTFQNTEASNAVHFSE